MKKICFILLCLLCFSNVQALRYVDETNENIIIRLEEDNEEKEDDKKTIILVERIVGTTILVVLLILNIYINKKRIKKRLK